MKFRISLSHSRSLALVAILGLLALAGCSSDASAPSSQAVSGSDDYEDMDFSLPNGGLTASEEDVAFGDEAFKNLLYTEDEDISDDPLLDDPHLLQLEAMAADSTDTSGAVRPRFTFVRLEWGMIRGIRDSLDRLPDCDPLDWSGTVSVDRGLLAGTRLIRFELPYDRLVRPRVNGQVLGFISQTYCHFDGLVLKIAERPEDQAVELPPNVLHINTGPYQGDFLVEELLGMNDNFPVDGEGNSLHVVGYGPGDVHACPRGFLHGRWDLLLDTADDAPGDTTLAVQYGTFGGPWYGLDGLIHGFMRCGYGLDADGNQVFHGKRIGRLGYFVAFINGTWSAADDGISLTGFDGQWTGSAGARGGVLGAQAYPFTGYPGGFYDGRWTTLCGSPGEEQIN